MDVFYSGVRFHRITIVQQPPSVEYIRVVISLDKNYLIFDAAESGSSVAKTVRASYNTRTSSINKSGSFGTGRTITDNFNSTFEIYPYSNNTGSSANYLYGTLAIYFPNGTTDFDDDGAWMERAICFCQNISGETGFVPYIGPIRDHYYGWEQDYITLPPDYDVAPDFETFEVYVPDTAKTLTIEGYPGWDKYSAVLLASGVSSSFEGYPKEGYVYRYGIARRAIDDGYSQETGIIDITYNNKEIKQMYVYQDSLLLTLSSNCRRVNNYTYVVDVESNPTDITITNNTRYEFQHQDGYIKQGLSYETTSAETRTINVYIPDGYKSRYRMARTRRYSGEDVSKRYVYFLEINH